jgi:molybdate transport system ATP-binding protein
MLNINLNIEKTYSKTSQITANINYSNPESSVLVLFGPSGSGKSTILRCIAGLERPSKGEICFNGQTWVDTEKKRYLTPQNRHIGYLFQDYALFPHLTILNNIIYGLGSVPRKQQYERAKSIMSSMQLEGLEKRFPKELSGGQQQRVALARALVCRPNLLLLDEPLSAIDEPTRDTLRLELKTLLKAVKVPTIVVTHDLKEAVILADEMIICSEGKTIQNGIPLEILARPKTLSAARIVGVDNTLPGTIVGADRNTLAVKIGDTSIMAVGESALHQNVLVCIRPEDINIIYKGGVSNGMSNLLSGSIIHIQEEGSVVRLTLECGFHLQSLMTRSNFIDMSLCLGMRINFSIKETSIHLIPA